MVKRLFFLLIIISILNLTCQRNLSDDDTKISLGECLKQSRCYLEEATPKCLAANSVNTTSYEAMKKSLNALYQNASISQLHCGTSYEKCINLAPDEGIEETCTNFTKNISDSTNCCYMKVSYDKNKKYSCYPVKKDKDEIKALIDKLKIEYIGSKKISIDCYSQNMALSFFALFFVLFWL